MKLAEVYEIMGEPRKALDLVYEGMCLMFPSPDISNIQHKVIDSRKKPRRGPGGHQNDEPMASTSTSLFTEEKVATKPKPAGTPKQNRLSHAQLQELEVQKEKEVVRGYRRLKDLWGGMLSGDAEAGREWMIEAEKLVDMFRETRNLFLTSRVCLLL